MHHHHHAAPSLLVVTVPLRALTNEGGVVTPAPTSQFSRWAVAGLFSRWLFAVGGPACPPGTIRRLARRQVLAGFALPAGIAWIWGRPFQRLPCVRRVGDVAGDWEKSMISQLLLAEIATTLRTVFHLNGAVLIPSLSQWLRVVDFRCTLGEIPSWILYLSNHDIAPLRRKPPWRRGLVCTYTRLASS